MTKKQNNIQRARRATRQEALDDARMTLRMAEYKLKEFEDRYSDGNMFTGANEIKKAFQDRVDELRRITEQLEKMGT